MWSDDLEPILLAELTEAYTLRQVFLAEMQAAMFVKTLAKALSGGADSNSRVSDVELLREMGIAI